MSPLIASRERLIALSGDWMRARLRRFPPFLAGYLETLQDGIGHAVATRAVEGKYVAEERPDVIGDEFGFALLGLGTCRHLAMLVRIDLILCRDGVDGNAVGRVGLDEF